MKAKNIMVVGEKGNGMSYKCMCIFSCCVDEEPCCSDGYCFKQKEYEDSLMEAEAQ